MVTSPQASMSTREVLYGCGKCKYFLNLDSSNRCFSNIGKKYSKKRKRVISFSSIDENRFRFLNEFNTCGPYDDTPACWGLHRARTKLLCGNCEAVVGYVKENAAVSEKQLSSGFNAGASATATEKFMLQIKALQPLDITEMEEQVKKLQNDFPVSRDETLNESTAVKKKFSGETSTVT